LTLLIHVEKNDTCKRTATQVGSAIKIKLWVSWTIGCWNG